MEKALKPKAKIVKKSLQSNPTGIIKLKDTPHVKRKKSKKKKRNVSEGKRKSSNSEEDNKSAIKQKNIAYEENNTRRKKDCLIKEKHISFQKQQKSQKSKDDRHGLPKQQSQISSEKHTDFEQKEKKKEKLGGLIFMCNTKTKPDCFRYCVMGLPLSKKDIVLGVKPGLKLFLYDFDLRLLYGVYKASSSGGVKLEPTAFNGAFPVQVRFVVHNDCYPLHESVFRKAIKENYNERNKFETELTVRQVKKLLELFRPVEVGFKTPAIRPQAIMRIQDGKAFDGTRETRLRSYQEPFSRDSHPYEELRSYSMLPHENDRHVPFGDVSSQEKEDFCRDTFLSEKDYRTYGLRKGRTNLIHESDKHVPFGEVSSKEREEFSQDIFLSEKEYRAYGLRRGRANLAPPRSHISIALESYPRGHARDNLVRNSPALYRDLAAPVQEPTRHAPLSLNERDYRSYVGSRQELEHSSMTATVSSVLDSYPKPAHNSSHYGASSVDLYPQHSRRDDIFSGSIILGGRRETYPIEDERLSRKEAYLTEIPPLSTKGSYVKESDFLRRENDDAERIYSTDASSAHTGYNGSSNYQGSRHESSAAPVSSRYSFAGPSSRYR